MSCKLNFGKTFRFIYLITLHYITLYFITLYELFHAQIEIYIECVCVCDVDIHTIP